MLSIQNRGGCVKPLCRKAAEVADLKVSHCGAGRVFLNCLAYVNALFSQICVLGSGLLGSSLLMAAKRRKLCARAVVWSRSEGTRAKARLQPWCDGVFDTPQAAVEGSDLVVLCAPVEAIPPLMAQIAPSVSARALVTDVGSVKQAICASGEDIFGGRFIGSHPMAGSEKTGLSSANEQLFERRACFVTPSAAAHPADVEKLEQFWAALGMRVERVQPALHDEIVARVSHLPHAVAGALCAALAASHPEWKQFSGNGLRDTTRIAASDPELWKQIFAQNRTALLGAMDDFAATFERLRSAVERGDDEAVKALLTRASQYRSDWPEA